MTLAYASPEQVARQPLGVATDVYSLGVMLYELLSGTRPYQPARESMAALEEAIQDWSRFARATSPQTACCARGCAVISTPLCSRRCGSHRRSAMPRSIRLPRISSAFFRDGLSARARNTLDRARKFVGRNRIAVSAAAVVCLAVVAGAGVATWQARLARAEQARAEAVKDFIASIFRDVDPNLGGEARPLTAVEVLSLARDRLETQLTTAPDVRFELRRILGDSLVAVGDPGEGRRRPDESARGGDERAPDGESTLIETELLLAEAKQDLVKTAEADRHLDLVLAALERTGRLQTEEFVKAKMSRAHILVTSGRAATTDAEAASREALDAATRILGPSHEMRATALGYLSAVYRTHSKHDLALANAEEAYRLLYEAHGRSSRDPRVIRAQNEYGRALFQVGQTAKAVAQMKEAAVNAADVLRDDPMTLQHLLGTLANVQLVYGEIAEARVNFEQAVAMDLRGVRLSDTYRASQDGVKARILLAARRPAEALPFYERAVEGYRKSADTTNLLLLEAEYGETLGRLGRFREARALLERIAAGRRDRDPHRPSAAPCGNCG